MKRFLLLFLICFGFQAQAQNDVYLRITHTINGEPVVMDEGFEVEAGYQASVKRLEYYIGNISIDFDDQSILASDVLGKNFYILANADGESSETHFIGSYPSQIVEGINFKVGVSAPENFNDPSLLPADNPLAPQNPSMHWGWAAGYRFAAVEGYAGSDLSTLFEIHALGEELYFQTEVEVDAEITDQGIYIDLKADYVKAFTDLDVSTGVISHGSFDESITLLENFRDHVFTDGEFSGVPSGITEQTLSSFDLFPNPSSGVASLRMKESGNYELRINDLSGKTQQVKTFSESINLEIANPGYYFIQVLEDGKIVATTSWQVLR